MAPPEIPGFYYDEAKKKYFKILPNHVAPQGSHYSKDAVRKEAESKLLQKKADKSNLRRQQTRVQHSQILEHPFGGRISLQREFGVLNALMRDNTMSWALGLRKKDRFSTGFPLSCFVRDDATGSLVCATSFNGRDAVIFALPTSHPGPKTYYEHGPTLFLDSPISSLALSSSRMLMTTAMGGSQKACVHLTRLKSPEEINSMNHPVGDTEVPCIFDFTPDISINIGSKPGNTFWASSARPRDTSSEFALATSAGTILIAENQASYSFERTQTFGSGLVEGHSEVLAVDWLDTNVTLNGHRNGKVKLWDARTEGPEGTSSRVQHPSTITHVRRTNDHKIAVAGLENQLCIYDMRFLTQKVPFVDGPTNPYLRFHSYQNWGLTGLAVGFDVCRGLIAAGADRDMMQLFDSERGGELKMSPQLELRKRDSLWPARCIRFAEGESTREAPKLFVAAGDFTEKWAW